MQRRRLLGLFVLTPLAAALAACGQRGNWPEGMVEIKWDRDTCARCGMVISDRRFAAQMRGGPKDEALKFDDIGCAVFSQRDKRERYPWLTDAATRLWVADSTSRPDAQAWLDGRRARYLDGRISPMGYNFAAVAATGEGIDYEAMRERVLAKGK